MYKKCDCSYDNIECSCNKSESPTECREWEEQIENYKNPRRQMEQNSWEEEFDRKWFDYSDKTPSDTGFQHYNHPNKMDKEAIKSFICHLLQSQREEIIEKLETIKQEFDVNVCGCGEKWCETDCAALVDDLIKELTK